MTSQMQLPAIRIAMADDSAVVRRLLRDVIGAEKDFEIVASATHGAEAVHAVATSQPDLVLLDVEMPVMDGVETVVEIRKLSSKIPIVMFSSITTRGGEATLDALAAGANDFVTKPSRLTNASEAMQYIRNELFPKLRMWGRRNARNSVQGLTGSTGQGIRPFANPIHRGRGNSGSAIEIIAIGASTGGPNALADVLKHLPENFPLPILITQHMPPVFTQLLAARLDVICPLHAREGVAGVAIQGGELWVAPGDYHMTVRNQKAGHVLHLDQNECENSCRPAVDPMFRSVAAVYGSRCLGVVLTGMGRDGENGSAAIRQAGGRVIVQDEASSVVWGMPRAVAEAGHADRVLSLSEITEEIAEAARRSNRTAMTRV